MSNNECRTGLFIEISSLYKQVYNSGSRLDIDRIQKSPHVHCVLAVRDEKYPMQPR